MSTSNSSNLGVSRVETVTRQHASHARGERLDYCLVCRIEAARDMIAEARAERDEAWNAIEAARRLLLSAVGAKHELSTYWYEAADAWLKRTRSYAPLADLPRERTDVIAVVGDKALIVVVPDTAEAFGEWLTTPPVPPEKEGTGR